MRWGLGARIFFLAVLAPMLATTVLVGYLLYSRGQDVRTQLLERGETVARQLAPALTGPLTREQEDVMREVVVAARLDPAIARVTIQRSDGRVLLESAAETADSRTDGFMVTLGSWLLGLDRAPSFRVPVVPPPAPLVDRLPIDSGTPPLGWVLVDVDAAPYLQREATMVARAAAVLGLVLLISLALGYWAARGVRRPLERLTETVRRLGAGDLRARVHLLAGGEVGRLARSINRMAIRQERNERDLNDQIDQATRELRETLEAVEIQNAELDIARKRALEGSKVKSEFLANMSHEIRTPINGILGFADLLSHSRLDEEQQDYVGTIRESCTNLIALVNDILDFSKIEAGKLVIDNVAFDMRDCIEEVLALMAPTAYGKSLELVHLIYQDVPLQLFGDPIRIRQVLTNLVHNAVKFTPEGRVVVRVMLEEEAAEHALLRISVTDTGIGMKPEEQEKLFKAFSQADTSITRRFGGAGLGLIISKKLVEQMGGEIGLESEPQSGSTFSFTLSCVKQRRIETDDRPVVGHNPIEGRQLLLYDTSTLSRLAVRHVLEGWDVRVRDAEDAATFQSLATAARNWDGIVVGLSRDELNRRDFRDLMTRVERLGCPVLVLASTVDRNELRGLYQQGAASCLPKAVRRQTLYRELCRLLDDRGEPHAPAPVPPRLRPAAEPAPAAAIPRARTRALVVDDNAINRKLVSTILRHQGVDVEEADDGHQAVACCRESDFSIVFMDIHMPAMSGEAASQAIRENVTARGGPVPRLVALTANALSGERERLLSLGLDECLIKPVSEQQVSRQLRLATGLEPDDAAAGGEQADADPAGSSTVYRQLQGEMQSMLTGELPDHRQAIRRAYRRGELEALRDHVHKLNGAASVCRAEELRVACEDLERAVAEDRRVDIPSGVERVVTAINQLLTTYAGDQ
ncbi:ATP-binding protein [Aquisalimonas lutea]|uniref:ATP-binding protein n=1 Tax=Aquisalimonas lutea TaxID=1327750 RepID=UPI0025B467FA|nr:ATP-binding protein [Aquisalimonas lutea]MDN3518555.1 ATP-binding protein [Aquisalimonas lutea]